MKYPTALPLLLSLHCAGGFSVAPRLSPPSLGAPLSSSAIVRCGSSSASERPRRACSTSLFSAAAMSADDAYRGGDAVSAEAFNIKYGPAIKLGKLKINLFGALYGMWQILWGVCFWYPTVMLYAFSRWITSKLPGNLVERIDPFRRFPIMVAYTWGLITMTPFFMWPVVEGRENLEVLREVDENGKKGKLKPAMYVANHSGWMDIPYVCRVFRFLNCKMIAKAELKKVPILGRALMVGGHVALDRTNRRSQMQTFKSGVQCLKDGVNLVTFPEGTRSKDSRLSSFKKGAFKMAQAVGAPVVPMAIHYADKVQPLDYAFPAKPSRMSPKAVIKIGKPISTDGKTDDELLEEVWQAIADDLPESQKPTEGTPVGVK